MLFYIDKVGGLDMKILNIAYLLKEYLSSRFKRAVDTVDIKLLSIITYITVNFIWVVDGN